MKALALYAVLVSVALGWLGCVTTVLYKERNNAIACGEGYREGKEIAEELVASTEAELRDKNKKMEVLMERLREKHAVIEQLEVKTEFKDEKLLAVTKELVERNKKLKRLETKAVQFQKEYTKWFEDYQRRNLPYWPPLPFEVESP